MRKLWIYSIFFAFQQLYAADVFNYNDRIVAHKLECQKKVDEIQQSLILIDEQETQEILNIDKYTTLLHKEKDVVQNIQHNVSIDTAYAILNKYQELDNKDAIRPNERVIMKRLQASLQAFQYEIQKVVSVNKNIGISQIIVLYPCNMIYQQIFYDYLVCQNNLIRMYENYIDTSVTIL